MCLSELCMLCCMRQNACLPYSLFVAPLFGHSICLPRALETAAKNVPILFCANKTDLAEALTSEEIAVQLSLTKTCEDRAWSIVATNALQGTGVHEAMNWLVKHLPKKK